MNKLFYSGFHLTFLDTLLRNLGVKMLISVGFATNACLHTTLTDAMYRNYRVVLLRDCPHGMECETKLFYTGKAEYADHKKDDPFLSALAEGGFQVGEMAKLYFPGGQGCQGQCRRAQSAFSHLQGERAV